MSTTLTGSEKQIEWAESIRANYVAVLTQLREAMTKAGTAAQPGPAAMLAKLDAIAAVVPAAWWIDNRFAVSPATIGELADVTLKGLLSGNLKTP